MIGETQSFVGAAAALCGEPAVMRHFHPRCPITNNESSPDADTEQPETSH
jgi:hypothetical protein